MPVVPEKRQLEDHVHAAVGAQFWSQGIENSRCLSGQACTAPCEPQPLRLTAPSGLSRTQFLVATRAARLPLFPGYCEQHGGTVVDRVLLQSGGQGWWGALVGRAKLQRGWHQHTTTSLRDNLSDPGNYALAATGRLQLSQATVLKATLQSDSLQALEPLLPQQGLWQQSWPFNASSQQLHQHEQQQHQQGGRSGSSARQQPQQQQGRLVRLVQGNSLKVQLKQQLEGLELTGDLAVNEACVEGVTRYATTPLRLALDIAPTANVTKRLRLRGGGGGSRSSNAGAAAGTGGSSSSSSSGAGAGAGSAASSGGSSLQGLLFRAGFLGVVAPVQEGTAGAHTEPSQQQQRQQQQQQQRRRQQQHRLSLHAQGALALTGTKTLWEAGQKPWQAAADAGAAANRKRRKHQQQQRQQQQEAELAVQPQVHVDSRQEASSSTQHGQPAAPDDGSGGSGSRGGGRGSEGSKQRGAAADKGGSRHARGGGGSSSSSRGGKQKVFTLRGEEFTLPVCSADSVQESIQDASSRLERMRTDLRSWRGRVEAGELHSIGVKPRSPGLLATSPGSCWSSFIPAPHVKVSGLIGLLGRVPLHQQTLLLPAAATATHSRHHRHHHQQQHQQQQHASRSSSSASLDGNTTALQAAESSSPRQGQAGSSPSAPAAAAATGAAADGAGALAAAGGGGGPGPSLRPESARQPLAHRARDALTASAGHLDRLLVGSARALGHSLTRESLLRGFGSVGLSCQVGEMRRNVLDFSRLEAVLDLGLNGPLEQDAAAGGGGGGAGVGGLRQQHARAHVPARGGGGGRQQHGQRGGASGSSKGSGAVVRAPSPARGLTSILGPAAAAAAASAAAAAQPPPPPPSGSSGGSPRSSTVGSVAAPGAHSPAAGGAGAGAASSLAPLPSGAAAASGAWGGGGAAEPAAAGTAAGAAHASHSQAAAAAAAGGQHRHPAFALEQRGSWHALTLSATQQLFGPLRVRADWRLALDSVHPCPRGAGLLQPSGPLQLLRHVGGVRPALVDAAYGVDVVVPGAAGLVRLVGWWNPGRGEGGLGLRLM